MASPGIEPVPRDRSSVLVYSTPGCKFCTKAKGLLSSLGVPFTNIDVSASQSLRAAVQAAAGGRTSVPQVFVAGEYVGGSDELHAEEASGGLAKRLERAGIARVDASSGDTGAGEEGGEVDGGIELGPVGGILNFHGGGGGDAGGGGGGGVEAVARGLQGRVLAMYDAFLTRDGSRVDFGRMRGSKLLAEYVRESGLLRGSVTIGDLESLSEAQRKAFFINVYNALTLHASLALREKGPSSAEHRGDFFGGKSGARYDIGGQAFSLDDIEHGILRASPRGDARGFPPSDPRARLVAASLDPRIHFALNCGASSCPPIKLYDADNLEDGLNLASQAFCDSEVSVQGTTISLSKILFWYGSDFGDTEEAVLRRVCGFMGEGSCKGQVEKLLDEGGWEVEYREYDWSQNASEGGG